MNLALVLAVAAIVTGPIVAIAFSLYIRRQDGGQEDRAELLRQIGELRAIVGDLASKDKTRTPYFDELQRSLASDRHRPSPEHAEMDRLLEELQALTLTPARRTVLEKMLQAEIDDPEVPVALSLKVVSDDEKLRIQDGVDNARLLLATMPKVLAGQKAKALQSEIEARTRLKQTEPDEQTH
jgi:hypothetical protein